MLGRNTEMNLLQMNKQKRKCLRNSVYFPGLLDRGWFRNRGVFCNFFVKPLTKADCLPGHFPGEGRFCTKFC